MRTLSHQATQSGKLTKKLSSQEEKSDEVMEVRTERIVNEQPPGLFAEHTDRFIVENEKMNSYTEAESEMSLKSRSVLHRESSSANDAKHLYS